MALPPDYLERVYAGVLGKIIGVYLGRPFEGWTYDRILSQLGEICSYVHERPGVPLVVTDDDISGTFTFLRALPDYGNSRDLTPAQIGQTWLNYILENRTILWWGGLGHSTEHTAFLRLKSGIPAPQSGSIALNGKIVAEQIGAQIFIDGWGMVAPGDPALAADLAKRAASVSHDGEAIYGAQIVAAMEALAFVEPDIQKLLDTALTFIPADSVIARMIADIRAWHAAEKDWRKTREQIAANYGYDKYTGNCHIVPNHALIIHALLHGEGDFQKSLMIVNTCGWDTDCNSGNVGCLLGIRGGLAGIDNGPDWRGPVADQMYLPTADGGRCITDAVAETYRTVNIGRALAGQESLRAKEGARFHFNLPGSAQGFRPENSIETKGVLTLENVEGRSAWGERSLAFRFHHLASGRAARAATPTFIPPDALAMGGYGVIACPTLYPGQTVRTGLYASKTNTTDVSCHLYLRHYDANDRLTQVVGPGTVLAPGGDREFTWRIPDLGGYPIAEIGLEILSEPRADGAVYLDYLTWSGAPEVTLRKTPGGTLWRRAWVEGVDYVNSRGDAFQWGKDEGVGLLIQGCREWKDYQARADITPQLAKSAGLAARVQGLKRYYALLLCEGNRARLIKALDGEKVLAEAEFAWQPEQRYNLQLSVVGNRLRAGINAQPLFDVQDFERPLEGGAIALICEAGRATTTEVHIQPAF